MSHGDFEWRVNHIAEIKVSAEFGIYAEDFARLEYRESQRYQLSIDPNEEANDRKRIYRSTYRSTKWRDGSGGVGDVQWKGKPKSCIITPLRLLF
jgi:hypothetical protein